MANEGTPGDYFRRQLLRYRDLLANFSKRNKELYFRPGKGSSLNLSIYQMSRSGANEGATENSEPMANEAGEIREEKEFEFIPLTINSLKAVELTKTSTIDLTEHFDLRDNPNKQIEKRLEKIRSADSRYQKEFGISGAWLLGPFLLWRDSPNAPPEELLISPIFKLPIDLTLSKQKRWELKIEEAELGVNPSLQLALSKRIGLTIPDEIEADTLYGAVSTILSKLASNGRQVTVISTAESEYRFANGGLLQKEEITPLSKSVESGLAKIRLDVASKAKRKHGLKLPSILGKQKVEKDADGNIIGRRATSLADDLTEAEQCYYSAASFEHFIVVDAFYIDHVSATRMPLFRDYEQVMADLTNHQLITELLGQGPLPTGSDKAKLPRELDRYRERENFFVIPTDSSQHAAINLCSKSPAIVIQGPPGTGKSQTISNLIADKIANGKKVLFVAEKRAALDVVYTRLKQAGIDKQAVLIHSSEINKKELYTSFLELADSKPREDDKAGWDRVTNKLDRIKEEVHGYYDAAAQPFRDTGLTNSDVLALFAANSTGEQSSDNTEIGDHFAKHVKGHDLDELVTELGKLQTLIQSLGNLENHPWANKKHDLVITAPKISALRSVHSNINKSIDEMSLIESKMKAIFPAVQMSNLARLSFPLAEGISHKLIDAIKVLLLSANPEEKVQSLKNQIDELMSALRDSWKDYRKFKADADHDLLNELKTYVKIPRGIFARMSQSYWRMKRVCRAVMTDDGFVSTSFSNMDERPIKHFDGHKVNLDKLFTSSDLSFIWSGFKKEGASFEDFEETVKAANKCLDEARSAIETLSRLGVTALASKVFENLESAKSFAIKVKEAESLSARIATISSSCNQEASLLNEFFEEPPNLGNGEPKTILNWISQLLERVSDCEIIERIELICHNFGERNGLPGFRRAILPRLLPLSEAWGERTKREICRIWYDEVRSTNIQVRGFDRKLFEDTVHEFKNIETAHCEAARIAVNDQFARRWTSKAPDYTAIALLKKESTKQRRILYPREVMEKGALETMLRLKPCWLMSPLSVSQILPLVKEMFDVIVFDEASQVRVEDAIPAIYRASTMVVVGDPKQMPPTNFFLGGGGDEPDDDEEEETDLAESILDLAARIYPAQMLEWHYRSKSEALIAFSNRAFYGGRLIAAPNPTNLGQDGSLMFVPVKDAIFNQKQGNTIEAETVIDHLEKILKENPNQSVGVISMGQSQRVALDQALERRMEKDKAFASAVKIAETRTEGDAQVGLFIKNLENVQGDERDIILISVGYAPAKPGKKVHLNFGPLSKQGGGRRLNVAITRARSKVVVFCSFSPDDISTDEPAFNSNPDTTCFGRYLKYAKAISATQIDEATAILNSFGVGGVLTKRSSSNFSRDVARRLQEKGYEVALEVGSSGFFIDVAVHHPTIPGNFVLGIECDGAMFHSTQYARDRDKARESLLTTRGWQIIRVWGPDWSRSWKTEIDRIESRVKELIGKRGGSNTPPSGGSVSDEGPPAKVARASSNVRYLTKSRYKVALECPTKLFYGGKPNEYEDTSVDDPFLMALARGGFQVGALAQSYFPHGILIDVLDHNEAVSKTNELLKLDKVTIFEAAVRFENLFIRVDILEKTDDHVRLIEVKSKSYDPRGEDQIFDKNAYAKGRIKIKSDYSKYIYDLAYQAHVLKSSFPNFKISSFLMLADKSTATSVEGLNQLFLLSSKNGRTLVDVKSGITAAMLGDRILCEVNMNEAVTAIHNDKDEGRPLSEHSNGLPYVEEVKYFGEMYKADKKITSAPTSKCKDCEFRTAPNPLVKSGFAECWTSVAKVAASELNQPFVFDVWDFRRSDAMIEAKKFFMKDLTEDDISLKSDPDDPGLSRTERQWLQICTATGTRKGAVVDVPGMTSSMSGWTFPLHFIDFETAMVAIPFNSGCRPYQSLAFQFSHHVIANDGGIEHVDQYLNMERGKFPNFDFVRRLKSSLQSDSGTIFRYSHHENTILCQIFEQLKVSNESDRQELMTWIQSITKSGKSSSESWIGARSMVDLCDIVKSFFYHPTMGGSNSIKKVLPAVLSDSSSLQDRFSKPIYGSKKGIKSLNYRDWTWIRHEGGKLLDPYGLLPKVYGNFDPTQLDKVMCDDDLQDGGSAMTAYAMMQFTEMSDEERNALGEALLKYCELDTFAMVLLYEYWREFVTGKRVSDAA